MSTKSERCQPGASIIRKEKIYKTVKHTDEKKEAPEKKKIRNKKPKKKREKERYTFF